MATITDTLKNKNTRWPFIIVILLVAAVFLLIRFALFPAVHPFISFTERALEAAAIALMTGSAIHAFALWLGPDHSSISLIRILDRAIETTSAFEKAFKSTKTQWYFKGGFGSYFRNSTLPELLKGGKTNLDIMIAVIDITNDSLVNDYANYRKQASGKEVNADKVVSEIKKTINFLAQKVKKNRGAFSSVKVVFLDNYSSFRLDFHDYGVILTQDNEKAPAIEFGSDSTYYQGFKLEFEQLKKKAQDLMTLNEDDLADVASIINAIKR
ncbi:MAG: hypothetical protein R8K20_00635 [Gallionellaceae bacterium]